MLFKINNRTGLLIMQIIAALSIIIIPSFLNMLSREAAVYCSFIVFMTVAALRIKANSKINFSIQHSIYAILLLLGVVSILWADNPSHHICYLFAVATVTAFSIVMKDYFAENSANGFKRRLAYLVSLSGTFCALLNVMYWLCYIVPVAGDDVFSKGLGTGDFLGIFMALSIVCTISLFKGNSKAKRIMMTFSVIMMLFSFIMAESFIAWIFAICVVLVILLKKKLNNSKKQTFIFCGVISFYFIAIIFSLVNTVEGKAIADTLRCFMSNVFGAGGGFWSGRESFSTNSYGSVALVGLLPYLSVTAGVIGLISCVLLLARSVVLFIKLKSTESIISVMVMLSLMLLPFGESIVVVLLSIGLNVYNEHMADADFKCPLKNSVIKKTVSLVSVFIIVAFLPAILSFVKMNAYAAFENGQYNKSYELYKFVSKVNFIDSDSSKMAALSIFMSDDLSESRKEEAILLIDHAIDGDKLNLEKYEIKAKIHYACEEYTLSAEVYRDILKKTLWKDKYNLLLSESLYKIAEENPKGSSESKQAYEEIMLIAQSTENLDYRKEIVDLADRAVAYTKGDFTDERENLAE